MVRQVHAHRGRRDVGVRSRRRCRQWPDIEPTVALLTRLDAALDVPPPALIAISERLWTLRTMDAELAALEGAPSSL
jgi:hypothetical protein